MICALCGPTKFSVTMRSFVYAGQIAYLLVCDTCTDKANEALARKESRAGLKSVLDTDVKPDAPPRAAHGTIPAREARARIANAGKKRKQPGSPNGKIF